MKSKLEPEMTGIEKIITNISEVIDWSIGYHDKGYDIDPIDFESLLECKDLCDKLLTHDYFNKSESYVESLNRIKYTKKFTKALDKWYPLYRKDLKEKRKDLTRLFKLIVDVSEDI